MNAGGFLLWASSVLAAAIFTALKVTGFWALLSWWWLALILPFPLWLALAAIVFGLTLYGVAFAADFVRARLEGKG